MSALQQQTVELDIWVLAILHPARIMRGAWGLQAAQQVYLQRLKKYMLGDGPPTQDYTIAPKGTVLYPAVDNLIAFLCMVKTKIAFSSSEGRLGLGLSIDIETAGDYIVCVGVQLVEIDWEKLTVTPGAVYVIRFRQRGGSMWHKEYADHVESVRILQTLLESPLYKIFQNGITFDVPELAALGFKVTGPYLDTLHLAHTAYPERKKGLQYLATMYLGAGVWKTLTDIDETPEKG